jgi:S1-C subfamily serine protease
VNCTWRISFWLLAMLLVGDLDFAKAADDVTRPCQPYVSDRAPQGAPVSECLAERPEEMSIDAAKLDRKRYIQRVLSRSVYADLPGMHLTRAGSGFFVAADGILVTSHRVVDGCSVVTISPTFGDMAHAMTIGFDTTADLALLRAEITPPAIATFTPSIGMLKQEPTYVIGYPNLGSLTTQPVLRPVEVLGSRKTMFSVSTMVIKGEVRLGNNGGALLEGSGSVVGAILASTVQTYAATDKPTDGVGLALPSEALSEFLRQNGIDYRTGLKGLPKQIDRLLVDARPFMAQVGCWQ